MKTYSNNTTEIAVVIFAIIIITLGTACSNSKKIVKTEVPKSPDTEIIVTTPCSDKNETDAKSIMALAMGESIDQNTSMSEAEDYASAKLAESVIKYISTITEGYSKNARIEDAQNFEFQSNRQIEKTAKTFLAGTRAACEKTYITNKHVYKTYCVMQMDRDAVEKYFENIAKSSSKLAKIEFDKQAFQQTVSKLKEQYSGEYQKKLSVK